MMMIVIWQLMPLLGNTCANVVIITPTEKKNETNKNLFINSITMF
jgi:hypothetical protein